MESFITSFLMVLSAEMGDKTQLLVFALSMEFGALPILSGALLAFGLLNGPGVFVGEKIAHLLSPFYIKLISGAIFFIFGLYLLLEKENKKEDIRKHSERNGFLIAFSSIFIGELGDKTQICSVVLGARFKDFGVVFSGCFIALFVATVLAVFLGSYLQKWLPKVPFKKISGLIMIVTAVITFGSLIL
ncbi:MAG: TMEM165/GDT1 family protein [Proteobacteria bacterium]|nr:TMEM165/GDT1 family protein [Pseudomonadota bacterium]